MRKTKADRRAKAKRATQQPRSRDGAGAISASAILATWDWPQTKRIELWINVELGEHVRQEAPIEEVRDWLAGVLAEHGWRRVPYHVRWLIEPGNEAIWKANASEFADKLTDARLDLVRFDADVVKHRSNLTGLIARYEGWSRSFEERRDMWLARAAECARAFFAENDGSRWDASQLARHQDKVPTRMYLRWVLTAYYHQCFHRRWAGLPWDAWASEPEAVDVKIDDVLASKRVRDVIGRTNGDGGPAAIGAAFVREAFRDAYTGLGKTTSPSSIKRAIMKWGTSHGPKARSALVRRVQNPA